MNTKLPTELSPIDAENPRSAMYIIQWCQSIMHRFFGLVLWWKPTYIPALQEQRSSIQELAQVGKILTLMITCMLEKKIRYSRCNFSWIVPWNRMFWVKIGLEVARCFSFGTLRSKSPSAFKCLLQFQISMQSSPRMWALLTYTIQHARCDGRCLQHFVASTHDKIANNLLRGE